MIKKFLDAIYRGEDSVEFFGDGSPVRDFMHVDDLADACVFLMNNYNSPDHINVGSGKDVSISSLAEIISKEVGFKGNILWDISKPNGSPRRTLDTSKMDAIGWFPKISLSDGIKDTISWYRKTGGKREL
jgi:GDP-L-fucose synthase